MEQIDCKRFREVCESLPADEATPLLRISMKKHADECPECMEWLEIGFDPSETVSEAARELRENDEKFLREYNLLRN